MSSIVSSIAFVWIIVAMVIFSLAYTLRTEDQGEPGSVSRIAMISVFWLPIILGLAVSFVVWSLKSVTSAPESPQDHLNTRDLSHS